MDIRCGCVIDHSFCERAFFPGFAGGVFCHRAWFFVAADGGAALRDRAGRSFDRQSPAEPGGRRQLAVGTVTVGPIIFSVFLFGGISGSADSATVTNINNLFLIVACVFAAVALFLTFSKLPAGKDDDHFEGSRKASGSLILMTMLIGVIIVIGQLTSVQKLPLLIATLVMVIGILFYSNGSALKNATAGAQ